MKLLSRLLLVVLVHSTMHAFEIQDEQIYSFLKPIKCSRSSLRCYLRHTLNHRTYIHEFIPRSFMHVIDLLSFAPTMEHPLSYFETVLSLFHERFQEARYVNPYALHELLAACAELIKLESQEAEDKRLQKLMADHMKRTFTDRFADFKQNPYTFLEGLAQELYEKSHHTPDIPRARLQSMLVRFIEQLCNKIVWDPREQVRTWEIFAQLAQDLNLLYDLELLPDEKSLNHQLWALIYRYGYFIECAGSEMTPESYETIKHELEVNTPPALLLEEQEELLTAKVERLLGYLAEGELKSRAKNHGIVTDSMVH